MKKIISEYGLIVIALVAIAFAIWMDHRADNRIEALEAKVAQLLTATPDDRPHVIDQRIQAYFDNIKKKRREAVFAEYPGAEASVPNDRRIYGSLNARFTLVEFSDLECPFCKRYHSTPKIVVDASGGMVNWEWVHLPLAMHNPTAFMQHQAAECAGALGGNPAFWVFLDQVFSRTRGGGEGAGDLLAIADEIGLDPQRFKNCVASGEHRDRVNDGIQKARSLGITGTPTAFLVDNVSGRELPLPPGGGDPQSIANLLKEYARALGAAQ